MGNGFAAENDFAGVHKSWLAQFRPCVGHDVVHFEKGIV